MAEKRRLPVLNAKAPLGGAGGPDDEPPRPPWHWVGFGIVLVFAAWLPLAWLAELLKWRVLVGFLGKVQSPAETEAAMRTLGGSARLAVVLATLGLPALAMALGAAAAGYVVGKFGDATTAREAGLSGVGSALLVTILVWVTAGFSLAPLAAVPLLGVAAWLGGRQGARVKR